MGRPKGSRNKPKEAVTLEIPANQDIPGTESEQVLVSVEADSPKSAAIRSPAGAKALAQVLWSTIGRICSLVMQLPGVPDVYFPTSEELWDICTPAARLMIKQAWGKELAKKAGQFNDWVDLALATASYMLRVYLVMMIRESMKRDNSATKVRQGTTEAPRGEQPGPDAVIVYPFGSPGTEPLESGYIG